MTVTSVFIFLRNKHVSVYNINGASAINLELGVVDNLNYHVPEWLIVHLMLKSGCIL